MIPFCMITNKIQFFNFFLVNLLMLIGNFFQLLLCFISLLYIIIEANWEWDRRQEQSESPTRTNCQIRLSWSY